MEAVEMMSEQSQTGINRDEVIEIITSSLQETLELSASEVDPSSVSPETRLVGHSAVLDSMGLVSLILDIEQRVNDQYDVLIILADERAMSQKQSPFRSVSTLADYIVQLIQEQTTSA
jgi:acyl carrier protein